jgi:hypothetical protein
MRRSYSSWKRDLEKTGKLGVIEEGTLQEGTRENQEAREEHVGKDRKQSLAQKAQWKGTGYGQGLERKEGFQEGLGGGLGSPRTGRESRGPEDPEQGLEKYWGISAGENPERGLGCREGRGKQKEACRKSWRGLDKQ